MAVKIKLKRIGKTRNPQYRIVIADSRTARSGRAIEEIGIYQPRREPSLIQVDSERAQYWLGVGAQPTEPVLAILKVTGDWQRFKGLPGAEGTLKVAEPKADKQAVFEAAVKSAEDAGKATKARAPRLKEEVAEVVHHLEERVEAAKDFVVEKVEELEAKVAGHGAAPAATEDGDATAAPSGDTPSA